MPPASLSERVNLWLANNKNPADLDMGTKEDIQQELRAWIVRRFRNYADSKQLRLQCQARSRELLDFLRGGARPSWTNAEALTVIQETLTTARRGEELSRGKHVQNNEAEHLCESLKVRHDVEWLDLSNNTTKWDHDIVAALMVLGQADVDMQTLRELQDVEDELMLGARARELEAERREFEIQIYGRVLPPQWWV